MRTWLPLFVVILAAAPAAARAATYYVDCTQGSDRADGLAPARAWRSVDRVSNETFRPGDAVRFRRGTSCAGMLWPKGSGAPGAFITLGAFGSGPLPKIESGPAHEAALKLFDQQYWRVENLEFSGGDPYGIFVSGTRGVLRSIHMVDLVVHDVTGTPKVKDTGLVVIGPSSPTQRFDDVLVDGVTAYRTSQWVGILVGGARFGFPTEETHSTNVVIRNSTVYDVQGDGIILFGVTGGRIEHCVTWQTGMQETQTIGTPNAIWTWMCRDCAVEGNEAFLSDSPGVDGGAYDIDYGNANNLVAGNYGHDTQGYCVAVFAAHWVTTDSVVRNNVCAANGRSPRLARRQGAIFLDTWNEGKLKGVRIEGNRIFWNPPADTPAIVNRAAFEGTGTFRGNTVRHSSTRAVASNSSLLVADNRIEHIGAGHDPAARPAVREDSVSRLPELRLSAADGTAASLDRFAGRWLLVTLLPAAGSPDRKERAQVNLLRSAARQFRAGGLETVIVANQAASRELSENLRYDWDLGSTVLLFHSGTPAFADGLAHIPSTFLLDRGGRVVSSWNGLTSPGDLGLALRSFLGEPDYGQMTP